MSTFSYQIKQELCKKNIRRQHCALAELAGIVHMSSAVSLGGSGAGIKVTTEHRGVVTRLFSLVSRVFGIECELSQSSSSLQKEAYTVKFMPKDLFLALSTLGITLNPGFGIDNSTFHKITQNDCCKAAYIRGGFLGSGTVSDPSKEYHLEFVCGSLSVGQSLRTLLGTFEIAAKITQRKDQIIIYEKDIESLVTTLSLMGAHNSVLELENIRIVKGIRGNVNRQINFENANIDRSVQSAMTQLACIEQIEASVGLDALSPAVQDAALLRKQYPEANLSELAELAGTSRSAMNNRLRKMVSFAKELQQE